MIHKWIRYILIFLAILAASPMYMGVNAMAIGENPTERYWWFADVQEWANKLTVVVLFLVILYAAYALLKTKVSWQWWTLAGWLVASSLNVLFVGGLYVMEYRCNWILSEVFQSFPSILAWSWAFLLASMFPWSVVGATFASTDLQDRSDKTLKWQLLERIVLGFVGIWSCFLATFGITIWDILPSC